MNSNTMSSEKDKCSAEETIRTILGLLGEDRMKVLIDFPVEEAASTFRTEISIPIGHHAFLEILSDFISHVYSHTECIMQQLTPSQASSEAVSILERYHTVSCSGYDAAFLDAFIYGKEAIDLILIQAVQLITESLRSRYSRWVYFRHLENLDWQSRSMIAKILLEHIEEALPDYISGLHPSQFADHIPDLINVILPTVSDVKGIIGHQFLKDAR